MNQLYMLLYILCSYLQSLIKLHLLIRIRKLTILSQLWDIWTVRQHFFIETLMYIFSKILMHYYILVLFQWQRTCWLLKFENCFFTFIFFFWGNFCFRFCIRRMFFILSKSAPKENPLKNHKKKRCLKIRFSVQNCLLWFKLIKKF